jgi:cytochrome c553
MPAAGFPRLAGQQATYLAKELQDFASGSRANSVMSPIAQGLSAQHRADLAAYFESLSGPFTQPAKADVRALTRGAMLAATGDQAKQLQACGNCHGPEGRGETGAAPYLAGQSSVYIRSAIAAWRAGTRKNDDGQLMASVPARLDDAAATAAAAYYEALGPASQ